METKRAASMMAEGENVIEASGWMVSMGEYPSRIIMRKDSTGYYTHVQVYNTDRHTFSTVFGHYDLSAEDATPDFRARADQNAVGRHPYAFA